MPIQLIITNLFLWQDFDNIYVEVNNPGWRDKVLSIDARWLAAVDHSDYALEGRFIKPL